MSQLLSLLKKKKSLLLEALMETDIDKTDIEKCILCIAENMSRFEDLKKLQISLSLEKAEGSEEEIHLNDEVLALLTQVRENVREIQNTILVEKRTAASALSDFTQVKSVANSYVKLNQGPVFVDKDFR